MANLYKTIETLCAERGINITIMCRESGAARGSLTDLKMGRISTLNTDTLVKIANYFNVSVSYLLGEKEAPAAESDERTVIDLSGLDEEQIAIAQEFMSLPPQKRAALVEFAKTLEAGE